MSDVLISIQPKWCELILSGKKIVEVRKSFPMENVGEEWETVNPFKCYIYCSKGKPGVNGSHRHFYQAADRPRDFMGGTVIAEFMCRKMEKFDFAWSEYAYAVAPPGSVMPMHEETALRIMTEKGCLTYDDITAYFGDEDYKAFFWHISDLKIYNEPKPLTNFHRPCPNGLYCESCGMYMQRAHACGNSALQISKPPQSWCYAEDQT